MSADGDIKAEIARIEAETAAIKSEETALKAETAAVKAEIARMKRRMFIEEILFKVFMVAVYPLLSCALAYLSFLGSSYYTGGPLPPTSEILVLAAKTCGLLIFMHIFIERIVPSLSRLITGESGTRRSNIAIWLFCSGFFAIFYSAMRRGFENIALDYYVFCAAMTVGGWWYSRRIRRSGTAAHLASGIVIPSTRNGFPALSWSQEVGTGRTIGGKLGNIYKVIGIACGAIGGAIGFYYGDIVGGVLGGLMGLTVGSWARHDVAAPDLRFPLQGGAGAPRAPRQLTEDERRELAEPETRVEDCEVFIEEAGDELVFCVARGDKGKGPLPVVARLPWETMPVPELGSHAEWMRSRATSSALADWHVIIIDTAGVQGSVLVAEWVHDRKWINDLRSKLKAMFIDERHEVIARWKLAKEEAKRAAGIPPAPSPADPAPVPASGEIPKAGW